MGRNLKYFLFIFLVFLFSQEEIDNSIEEIYKGNLLSVSGNFEEMQSKYPENPNLIYVKALLERNVDKSIEIYKTIYNYYPTSDYVDQAIMKVGEYYYSKGLYLQSSNWLKKIYMHYPKSDNLESSIKLFVNCLTVSGKIDSSQFYQSLFNKQFPGIKLEIDKIEIALPERNQVASVSTPEPEKKKKTPKQKIAENIPLNAHYTVQIGAYSDVNNAIALKEMLQVVGLDPRIDELYLETKDKTLYAVRIGVFNSKITAQKNKKIIKARTGHSGIVKSVSSTK